MNKFCVRISENKSVHERNAIAQTLTIESYVRGPKRKGREGKGKAVNAWMGGPLVSFCVYPKQKACKIVQASDNTTW